jgi:hypothetical protein
MISRPLQLKVKYKKRKARQDCAKLAKRGVFHEHCALCENLCAPCVKKIN